MENRVVTLHINFTRRTFVLLVVAVLLASVLVAGGAALAQTPDGTESQLQAKAADYDAALDPRLPQQMNYQGVLTDEDGNPIDGSRDLTVTIYERALVDLFWGWKPVYSETQEVEVTNGLFNVVIGESEPLNPGDFSGLRRVLFTNNAGELELGVSVDRGTELSPRMKLLPVPYAFRAEYVNRFPAPHYDSGWVAVAAPSTQGFSHGLGGDPDDYVVDLMCQSTGQIGNLGIHNSFMGGFVDGSQSYGVNYQWLDSDSITIVRNANDLSCDEVRVRIWRVD